MGLIDHLLYPVRNLGKDWLPVRPVALVGGRMPLNAETYAAMQGWAFCRKANEVDTLSALTVITDAELLQAMESGLYYIITCIYAHVSTGSDTLEFGMGVTENADGSGAFTPLTPNFHIETGSDFFGAGAGSDITPLNPPIVLTTDDGGAFTIRAQTNDDAAQATFGLNGFTWPQ